MLVQIVKHALSSEYHLTLQTTERIKGNTHWGTVFIFKHPLPFQTSYWAAPRITHNLLLLHMEILPVTESKDNFREKELMEFQTQQQFLNLFQMEAGKSLKVLLGN